MSNRLSREELAHIICGFRLRRGKDTASGKAWEDALSVADRISKLFVQLEAPKVEPNPYGWVIDRSGSIFPTQAIAEDRICKWRRKSNPIPLYTHPAPSSDELLEAIAKDAAERVHKNGGCVPQLAYAPILFALQDGFAKHKGPQS